MKIWATSNQRRSPRCEMRREVYFEQEISRIVCLSRIWQDDVVNITLLHIEINNNMFVSRLLLDNIYYIYSV